MEPNFYLSNATSMEHPNGNPGRTLLPCREKGDFNPKGCIAAEVAPYQVPFDIPDPGRILQGQENSSKSSKGDIHDPCRSERSSCPAGSMPAENSLNAG